MGNEQVVGERWEGSGTFGAPNAAAPLVMVARMGAVKTYIPLETLHMTSSTNQKERLRHLESRQRELERRMAAAERELERLRSSTERRFGDVTRDLNRLEARIHAGSQHFDNLLFTILIMVGVSFFVALVIFLAAKN